ncbi:phosphate ABC transporter permease [Phycisphaera mikurensis]|uniref:Putative phosphate ABC transporter permease protein n=1 Tax=Phycisphaera mikurensis (strain NBRC 102666 / KCTC 22515 / FYK2301M01) TaxID=1142394 RepID=I0IFR7_PHYMF|nr:ABC transporter permease subunit [Phycisphaera mikurensis]MBB6440505.1 phosphate transport system permease protein [Phycisphaera mikurensis]BAM04105.1 putative phosphate ABC transporter permease protein [Phycisphaera mikurensis NBRC 102666]
MTTLSSSAAASARDASAPPPPAGAGERTRYPVRSRRSRVAVDRVFQIVCIAAAVLAISLLVVLIVAITFRGAPRLFGHFGEFLTGFHSSNPLEAGIAAAIVGTLWLLLVCAISAIPLGVGTAVLLEEYRPKNRFLRWLHGLVQLNITNLAGVPSIVYGILGLTVFAGFIAFNDRIGDPLVTVGQSWFRTYESVGGEYFYVPVATRAEAEDGTPAAPGMAFLDAPRTGAASAEVDVRSAAEVAGVERAVDEAIRGLERKIKTELRAAQEGGRGPAAIDDAKASAMAAAVFDGVTMRADLGELSGIATASFRAMDGQESMTLMRSRRELAAELTAAEIKANGVGNVVAAGTASTPIDHKAAYYMQLPFGRGLLAGGLTLMLVILPIIIVASQEAIRSVPPSMRAGCLALGGTKWQAIQKVVLPSAIPGICTGSILAMSRAIGEAAPLLMIGAVFLTFVPGPKPFFGDGNLTDSFTALPLQIFSWTSMPADGFRDAAAAGIIVLLAILLVFNLAAILIRQKYTAKD